MIESKLNRDQQEKLHQFDWAISKVDKIFRNYCFYGTASIYGDPKNKKVVSLYFDFSEVKGGTAIGLYIRDDLNEAFPNSLVYITDPVALEDADGGLNKIMHQELWNEVQNGVQFYVEGRLVSYD